MKTLRTAIIFIVFLFSVNGFAAEEKIITIVHTNDLHSHFQGFSPELDYRPFAAGADKTRGGWSRIATVINQTKQERDNTVLVLDSGDYTMGSLFHMLAREQAFELRLMAAMGYDAVTLGNHEFDLKPAGLARILTTAKKHARLPEIVFAGAVFDEKSEADKTLEAAFAEIPVKPYTVLERDGIRIGIFGLMGKDAAEVAPFARPVTFRDPVEVARETVRALREKEKTDIVICLSHSGLNINRKKSEDEILAARVRGIDVIVSGHSHHLLQQPVIVGETIIVQVGAYGRNVGVLDIVYDGEKVALKEYKSVPVDSSITGDKEIQNTLDRFKQKIDTQFLAEYGLSYDQIIAQTKWDMEISDVESPLGNLIADSIRWYVNKVDSRPGDAKSRVVIAVESNGVIRDHLIAGETGYITVGDLFRTIPLGIGMDEQASMGYPLISFYLYGYEIKRALEILASVYPLKGYDYFLQVSGVRFTYNPNRVIFDRVTSIEIGDEDTGYRPLDYRETNRALYRVAANIYNATFLKLIGGFTYGFLEIAPKDSKGRTVSDLTRLRVDADKSQPGIQELKQWVGVIKYVQSFKDVTGDGIADIPEKYRQPLGRIVAEPSWNPVALAARPALPTIIAMTLLALMAVMIIYVGRRVMKRKKKRRSTLKFK